MKFNFTMPKEVVTVDVSKMEAIGKTAMEATSFGGNLCASTKLACYKMKTVAGNELPAELRCEVAQHVHMMRRNGWLTKADETWCEENHIK